MELLDPTASALLYLDPASVNWLVQMLVAGAVGAAVYIKMRWTHLRSMFSKDTAEEADSESTDA